MIDLIEKLLNNKVIQWFKSQGIKHADRGGAWKWVVGGGVALLVVLFVAYLQMKSYFKNKEYAKLRHAVDVAEQKKLATELKLDIADNKKKIDEYSSTIEELDDKIEIIDQKLDTLDTSMTEEVLKINAIKNWEEMDSYISHLNDMFATKDNNSGHLN